MYSCVIPGAIEEQCARLDAERDGDTREAEVEVGALMVVVARCTLGVGQNFGDAGARAP
jgi:hypothetical protein